MEERVKNIGNDGKGYGSVWVSKISNEGNNTVRFMNPYQGPKAGDVEPGQTVDNDLCHGYIPYWGESRKYEIHYYNEILRKRGVVHIKDLGQWVISFSQDDSVEHMTEVAYLRPDSYFPIQIIVKDRGFEVYDLEANERKGGLLFY